MFPFFFLVYPLVGRYDFSNYAPNQNETREVLETIQEETNNVVAEPTSANIQPIPGNTESTTETAVTSTQEKSHSNTIENPSSSNTESEK